MKTVDDAGRVLSAELQNNSGNHLLLAVACDNSPSDVGPVPHLRNGSEFQRKTVGFTDRDAADVVQRLQHADPAHQILLRADLKILPADIPVAGADRINNLIKRNIIRPHLFRVQAHLILENMAPHGENRRNAGHGLKLAFDHEIVQFPQIGIQLLSLGVDPFRIRLEVVDEDLIQSAGNRTEFRLRKVRGQGGLRVPKTFRNKLTGKIDVRPIPEIKIDHAHPEARGGFDQRDVRKAAHGAFNRLTDHPFHLFRRKTGGFRKDRNHHRRDVGKGVARGLQVLIKPEADDGKKNNKNKSAQSKRCPNDCFHLLSLRQ